MLIKWKTSSILSKDYPDFYDILGRKLVSMRFFLVETHSKQQLEYKLTLRKSKSMKKLLRPIKDKNFFIISFRRKLHELFVVSQFFFLECKKERM